MKTAAEVEAEVEASRSELDRNVEALKQKMTPNQMFSEASRMMGSTGQQVATKLLDHAKTNPLPFAVIGLGVAWLVASNVRRDGAAYGGSSYGSYPEARTFAPGDEYGASWQGSSTGYEGGSDGSGIRDKVHGLADKASDAVSGIKDKFRSGAQSAADGGRGVMQHASSAAGTVREKASLAGAHVQRSVVDTFETEPLLIAGLGLVVGAAIGAALPSTPTENRLMGETRDKILDRGKGLAQTGVEQARNVAQQAYGAVRSELDGATQEGDVTQKLGDVVQAGVDAVRDGVKEGVNTVREQAQGATH